MCRGSSSPQVILVAVKPVNLDRPKHTCAVMFSVELNPLFLTQTDRLTILLPDVTVDLLLPQHFRVCLGPHVFLTFRSRGRNPVLDHQLLTNDWNWLDSPAADVVLVAHLHVQLHVLLFGCSTVSQRLNPQKVAFAQSVPDGSLGGQARALALFAHFHPLHVTRHLAAWTNSDFGNFETWCDDYDHCPDD